MSKEPIKSEKGIWIKFIVLYLASLAVSLNQFKIPPIMELLSGELGVSMTSVAWLTSIFALTGIIFALPGAFILQKLGTKTLGICLLACLAIGSLLGYFSSNFTILLISRFIEGVSFSFIIMLGIVLINHWYEPRKVGVMTGIFSTFPALASGIVLANGAVWAEMFGWRSMWLGGAIVAIIVLVAFAIVIEDVTKNDDEMKSVVTSKLDAFKNVKAWLLGICLGTCVFVMFSFLNLYFTIFNTYYGLSIEQSGFYASIAGTAGIFFTIISGVLVSKTGKPAWIILISFIALFGVSFTAFSLTSTPTYLTHVLCMSLFTALVIPACLSTGPSTAKRPEYVGFAVAIVNVVYFAGCFAGTPITTAVVESSGSWTSAIVPMVISCSIGLIATIAYMVIERRSVRPTDLL